MGGVLGMLSVGIFAHYTINPSGLTATDGSHLNGVIFGDAALLGYQIIAICATVAFAMVATSCITTIVRSTIGLQSETNNRKLPV